MELPNTPQNKQLSLGGDPRVKAKGLIYRGRSSPTACARARKRGPLVK